MEVFSVMKYLWYDKSGFILSTKKIASTVHGASGITASPILHVPSPVSFGGTPVHVIIGEAAGVGDSFVGEGEDTITTATDGDTATTVNIVNGLLFYY